MGAEVIKIESPDQGDPLRYQGHAVNGLSWYYALFNRNKKSVTLNLRTEEGKAVLADLIRTSDVVVDNYRPGVMDKMGFGYERLKEIKPDVIHGSVSGFGADGPYSQRPAFDFIAQAMSGYMSLCGQPDGPPLRDPLPITDLIAGLYTAFGVVCALAARNKTGRGDRIQTAMMDGMIGMMAYMSANYLASGQLPDRTGNDHPIVAPYGMFEASDGEVAVAPSNDAVYHRLLEALELEHLKDDPRFRTNELRMRNREAINAAIEAKTRTRTKNHWIETLNQKGVPCGRVQNLAEVFSDPQVLHQNMVIEADHPGRGPVKMTGFPVKSAENPCQIHRPAPELGQHTEQVLKDLGRSAEDIEKLRKKKII
jgi:crotonobetainyl-CoA:carnitine CoA-transferase CaiB-like acyl-CoA transferase